MLLKRIKNVPVFIKNYGSKKRYGNIYCMEESVQRCGNCWGRVKLQVHGDHFVFCEKLETRLQI